MQTKSVTGYAQIPRSDRPRAITTSERVLGDGYHMDDAGHEQLAAIIRGPLLEWLSPEEIGSPERCLLPVT